MSLKQRAKEILAHKRIPGIDQDSIRADVEELGRILYSLAKHNPIEEQTIRMQTRLLYERAQRSLYHPTPLIIRKGLEELVEQLQDILEEKQTTHTFFVQDQRIKHAQAIPFKHVPYATIHLDRYAYQELCRDVTLIPEKTYETRRVPAQASTVWNIQQIGAQHIWNKTQGEGVRIGVIDTGIDYTHERLAHCFGEQKGYDFIHQTNNPLDDNGHGTHVAGTIASREYGVAPQATLYALKILNKQGMGRESDFIHACEWAITENIPLLNASLGSKTYSPVEEAIIRELTKHGITLVAAAGNSGVEEYIYPASYPGVISVGATDKHKRRATFSTKNNRLSFSAPGTAITSTAPGGKTATLQGTSMACPHVSGSIALLHTAYGAEAINKLTRTAETLGDKKEYGAGLIRPDYAL